jgi:predicted Zn-dependent protease with MMP-like domain
MDAPGAVRLRGMIQVSDEHFHELVEAAVRAIPRRYADHLQNVAFLTAEEPTPEQLESGGHISDEGLLLGLYEGIPLPARDNGYSGVLPDVITVFKHSHELVAQDYIDLRVNVRDTVWHEVAHYFGLDHGQIEELENR